MEYQRKRDCGPFPYYDPYLTEDSCEYAAAAAIIASKLERDHAVCLEEQLKYSRLLATHMDEWYASEVRIVIVKKSRRESLHWTW